jgi:hypothetical protein
MPSNTACGISGSVIFIREYRKKEAALTERLSNVGLDFSDKHRIIQ